MTPLRARWIAALLTLLVLLIPISDGMEKAGSPLDEGAVLLYPELVLKGAVPYRDFETFYGPANIYLLAVPYAVFGPHLALSAGSGSVYRLLVLGAIFVLLQRWGITLAVGGVTMAATLQLITGSTAFAWMGAMACGLWALWLGSAPEHRWRCGWAGFLAGLALLFRPDTGPAVIAGTLPLFLLKAWPQRRAFLIGGTCALVPLLVLTVVAGPVQIFNNLFLFPVIYSSPGRHMPRDTWPPYLTYLLLMHAAAVLINLAAGAAAVWSDRRSAPARVLLGLALFGLFLTHQALQRLVYFHVPFAAFASLAVVPVSLAVLFSRIQGRPVPHFLTAAAATLITFGTLEYLSPEFLRYLGMETWRELSAQEAPVWSLTVGGRTFPLRSPETVAFGGPILDDLTHFGKPGQRLFVGPGDLRRTNASDTFIYHLVPQFVPATYFLEMNPFSANRPNSRLTEDIASADWLVLNRAWDFWGEPNASQQYGPDAPNEVVRTQFERCARHGTFELYRRKARPQGT